MRTHLAQSRSVDRSGSFTILTYHTVKPTELSAFENQMRLLAERTKPVFADEPDRSGIVPRVAVTFDDAFQSVFDDVLPILETYRIPATVFVPTDFIGRPAGWAVTPGTSNPPSGPVVGARTLRSVDPSLVKIGSHSASHPRLGSMARDSVEHELVTSRQVLEHLTGTAVRLLALPYGSFDDFVLDAAERAGYSQVFANIPIRTASSSRSVLVGRVNASPADSLLELRLKATGAYEWLASAISVKRAVMGAVDRVWP